jgi:hypothetical protein
MLLGPHACALCESEPQQTEDEIRANILYPNVAAQLVSTARVLGRKFCGMRGSPEVCVARSMSVICLPPRSGIFT